MGTVLETSSQTKTLKIKKKNVTKVKILYIEFSSKIYF